MPLALSSLPPSQRALWSELGELPSHFTLDGGTAIALRLGHRASVDFDFFSNLPFDPDALTRAVPFLSGAARVQVAPNTLTCRIDRGGPVLVSLFGGLGLGEVQPPDVADNGVHLASLLDLAGTKVAVIQKRAELKDYLDLDALLTAGIGLDQALAAGRQVHGAAFNPLISIKALGFFGDLPSLPEPVRRRLAAAVAAVDLAALTWEAL